MSAVALIPLLPELGPEDDIAQFVARCDILMNILPDPEKIMLTSFILVKLQGKPRKNVVDAGATTWTEIKTALNATTKPVRLVEDVQAELSARSQRSGESVETYGIEMTRLLTELHKSYEIELKAEFSPALKTVIQRQAVRTFETGLQYEQLRLMVIMRNSVTLADAVACANNYESRLPKKSHPSANRPSKPQTPQTSGTNFTLTCKFCNKNGHTEDRCYQKKAVKTETTPGTYCNYCKQSGHLIVNCDVRKEYNRRTHGDENYRPPPRTVHHLTENSQTAAPVSSAPSDLSGNDQSRVSSQERSARLEDLPLTL